MWTGMSEKSQQIRDFLAPFLRSKNILVKPQNSYYGFAPYPSDYGRYASSAIWSIKGDTTIPCPNVDNGDCEGYQSQIEVNEKFYVSIEERVVDLIDENRWKACLVHERKKPTLKYPKMTQIAIQTVDDKTKVSGGWKVAPRSVSVLVLDYYTQPIEGTFKYTIVDGDPQTGAGDFIQYDPSSVPLQWPETTLNYFLLRLAKRYGMFINNQFLTTLAAQLEAA